MRQKKWRGTILFVAILVVMGATIGLKLYGTGQTVSASAQTTTSLSDSSATASQGGGTSSATATPTPTPSASSSSSSSSPSTSTASSTKTLSGSVVQTRFGPIQVQITVEGSKITAVQELQSPSDDRRSESINQQAAPILEQEVLASQSASIDTVSGATYTSDGYKQSLQSAIDQL
jgi:uncharacterized protein with FMN-binding domain